MLGAACSPRSVRETDPESVNVSGQQGTAKGLVYKPMRVPSDCREGAFEKVKQGLDKDLIDVLRDAGTHMGA